MKKMLFFIIVFASCSNPKASIVEREKFLKAQIEIIDDKTDSFFAITRGLINDTISTDSFDVKHSIFSDSIKRLSVQKNALEKEYDSLEMELKKY